MKTIGQYLKSARAEKNLSLSDVSSKTKIRQEFLKAIEKEEWKTLPEFSVVSGFVKNMADAVGMDRGQAIALLRRDYPPFEKKLITARPTVKMPREFRWSPRLTFFAGVGVIVIGIAAYLVAQYISFTRPPMLVLESPTENQLVLQSELEVLGETEPNASVIVNTQPALVSENGEFHTTIEITSDTTEVVVVATSRAGKVTRITRTIKPEL